MKNGYTVRKLLLIAPDFSNTFIEDSELDVELNLPLLTARSLKNILDGFKKSTKYEVFSYKFLMRDVLINSDRIIKVIGK